MDRFLYNLSDVVKKFTLLGWNYYISLYIFILCITLALVVLSTSVVCNKPRKNMFGLFVLYQIAFLLNVALCITESAYCGEYFKSPADAYAFCLAQFAVCIVFWFMLKSDNRKAEVEKKRQIKGDKSYFSDQCNKSANCPIIDLYGDLLSDLRAQKERDDILCKSNGFTLSSAEDDKNKQESSNGISVNSPVIWQEVEQDKRYGEERNVMPDINVSYINSLINALLAKDIQPEEREKLDELKIKLNCLPPAQKEFGRLNELLRFLLKRIAEYDITA